MLPFLVSRIIVSRISFLCIAFYTHPLTPIKYICCRSYLICQWICLSITCPLDIDLATQVTASDTDCSLLHALSEITICRPYKPVNHTKDRATQGKSVKCYLNIAKSELFDKLSNVLSIIDGISVRWLYFAWCIVTIVLFSTRLWYRLNIFVLGSISAIKFLLPRRGDQSMSELMLIFWDYKIFYEFSLHYLYFINHFIRECACEFQAANISR